MNPNKPTITSVEFQKVPLGIGNAHHINVNVQTTDKNDTDEKETIFSYYPDELSFSEAELIGLTIDEASQLRTKKDIAYLKS